MLFLPVSQACTIHSHRINVGLNIAASPALDRRLPPSLRVHVEGAKVDVRQLEVGVEVQAGISIVGPVAARAVVVEAFVAIISSELAPCSPNSNHVVRIEALNVRGAVRDPLSKLGDRKVRLGGGGTSVTRLVCNLPRKDCRVALVPVDNGVDVRVKSADRSRAGVEARVVGRVAAELLDVHLHA